MRGWTQFCYLARRSVIRTLRQPAHIVPTLTFPLFLLAVNSGGLQSATKLPGFPTDNFINFALAVTFVQGSLFAATSVGNDLARDIETGFLSRIALTPVRPVALLAGQLAGTLVIGLLQSVVYVAVGLMAGATIAAGLTGGLLIIVLGTLTAFAFGALGAALALKTGSGEAVQGFFPLLFTMLFLSSSNLPRDLIEQDWFRTIATYNPVSYLLEGLRSLIITGWDWRVLGLGVAVVAGMIAVFLGLSVVSLRERLATR